MPGDKAAPLRLIRKSDAWTKAVLHSWNGWIGAYGERQTLQPQGGTRIGFTFIGNVGEELRRVAIICPRQAQVQRQVLADLPVVATIEEGVILAEVQYRVARCYLDAVRRSVDEAVEAAVAI